MPDEFDLPASTGLTLDNIGDLIAALPAMIGFVPYRSLIVAALTRSSRPTSPQIGVVSRLDLPRPGDRTDTEAVIRVTCLCSDANAVAALAFIVDERMSGPSIEAASVDRYRPLHVALEQRLAVRDIDLIGTWCVSEIAAGGAWWNLSSPRQHGIVSDPTASPVAVQTVLHASAIYRHRNELVSVIAIDAALRDQVERLLPEVAAEAHQRFVRALHINNPDADTRMALWRVMDVLKRADDVSAPSPRELAEVTVALRDSRVRDALLGAPDGPYCAAAERVWTILTRALSGPDRAGAATMLAFHAYLRGDGVLAGVALDAALAADPEHRLAFLLDYGLRSAMHPDRLQRLVQSGVEIAAELRIDIGAQRPDPATAVER
ncbi:DUF4192 family protein [Nocardia sp. ET3-3]|uniref:DUF4192 family protein n=1 Tax=Nocardia terrae TaxID=2675851 RepID=A0A7K1UNF6_9NOCA|nr:DUF4192 domain-containing protein [Nocardia terrae]MVU75872.1 DUF4192 family protein [Nocardia terrae]